MLSRTIRTTASKRLTSVAIRAFYDAAGSVTYSGGQKDPTPQDGFYVSVHPGFNSSVNHENHRPEMIAMESDVYVVTQIMDEVRLLEELLEEQDTIESSLATRGRIKKLVTSHPFVDSLSRLECARGEPIWGLSMIERDMVSDARNKVDQS